MGRVKTRQRLEEFERQYHCRLVEIDPVVPSIDPLERVEWAGEAEMLRRLEGPEGSAQDHADMRREEYFRQRDETLSLYPSVALTTVFYEQRSTTIGCIRGLRHCEDGSE